MLTRWTDGVLAQVEWLIDDSTTFTLSPYIDFVADAERTSFAGRVGAGITDLLMNALGYTWRDNASSLSPPLDPHADFIYAGDAVSGHAVVLAEAHGSFAANVTASSIGSAAQRKYRRQVKPYLGGPSPHGRVIHGYSIGFASRPETAGAFLHVAETHIPRPRRRQRFPTGPDRTPNDEAVRTSLALSTHRANFALMNAPSIVRWIDWIHRGTERPGDTPVSFIQIPYAGRRFLACVELDRLFYPYADSWSRLRSSGPWLPSWPRSTRPQHDAFAGRFVMEENAAVRFLDSLSAIIRSGKEKIPDSIELPRIDPIGFGFGSDEAGLTSAASDYSYALYRDGLALLGTPLPRQMLGSRDWRPRDGMQPLLRYIAPYRVE